MFWPDDYLSRVARQIRVTRVRGPLIAELRDHMLCQRDKYMREGLSEAEAERRATEDMGDALLVGGALDAAHCPATPWKGLLAAVLLLILGLGIQLANGAMAGASAADTLGGSRAIFTALALAPLCLFACTDYTLWIRWSLPLFWVWLLMIVQRLWIWVAFIDMHTPEAIPFILYSPVFHVFVPQVLSVAAPICAALLACRLRGRGWGGLAISLAPVLALALMCWAYRNTGYDIGPCALMAAAGLAALALAVREGFFRVSRGRAFAALGGLLVPVLIFAVSRFSVQGADGELRQLIDSILRGARPIGRCAAWAEVSGAWRRFADMGCSLSDAMLPALVARLGWVPFALLMLGIAALLGACFRRFARMENRMGGLLGLAATLTLALQAALYVPASFGLIGEHLGLPLLSCGHAMLAADAALVGAMLGVLRGARLPEVVTAREGFRRGKRRRTAAQ